MTYRENFEKQSQQLYDLESEVTMLRRRIEMLESDKKKDEEYISSLQNSLATLRKVSILMNLMKDLSVSNGTQTRIFQCFIFINDIDVQ